MITKIYKGYKYKVIKMERIGGGYYNGYIEIPSNHKYYGQNYHDIDIDVHGGLTYSGTIVPLNKKQEEGWWIGFDTNHYDDYIYTSDKPIYNKNANFVEKECLKVIDQLVEIKDEKNF